MPIYIYRATCEKPSNQNPCEMCGHDFEMVQKMSDDALTACPECGTPIERVIGAPNLNGAGKVKTPSESTLSKSGFTQYKRKGKGYYEKTFGSGPSSLHP